MRIGEAGVEDATDDGHTAIGDGDIQSIVDAGEVQDIGVGIGGIGDGIIAEGRIGEGRDFARRERAIIELHFVNFAIEIIPTAVATGPAIRATDAEFIIVGGAIRGLGSCPSSKAGTIEIRCLGRAVVGHGDIVPIAVVDSGAGNKWGDGPEPKHFGSQKSTCIHVQPRNPTGTGTSARRRGAALLTKDHAAGGCIEPCAKCESARGRKRITGLNEEIIGELNEIIGSIKAERLAAITGGVRDAIHLDTILIVESGIRCVYFTFPPINHTIQHGAAKEKFILPGAAVQRIATRTAIQRIGGRAAIDEIVSGGANQ